MKLMASVSYKYTSRFELCPIIEILSEEEDLEPSLDYDPNNSSEKMGKRNEGSAVQKGRTKTRDPPWKPKESTPP